MSLRSSEVNVGKELLKLGLLKLVSTVLFLLLVAILTRDFTTSKIGVFFFMTAISFILIQFPSGYSRAVKKRMSERNGEYLSYYIILSVFLVLFLGCMSVLYFLLKMTVLPFSLSDLVVTNSVFLGIIIGSFGKGAAIASLSYFSGISRFSTGQSLHIIFKRFVPLVILYWLSRTNQMPSITIVFIFVQITGLLVYLIAPFYASKVSEVRKIIPSLEQFSSVNEFAAWSIPNEILNDFYHRIDSILLAFFLSATVVGYYESSVRLTSILFFLPGSIKSVLTVKVSGYVEEGKDFTNIVRKTGIAVVLFMLLGVIVAYLFGKQILSIAFGPEYIVAYPILVALTVQQVIQSLRITLESTFNGLDLPDVNTKITAITIAINLLFAPIFIHQFGGVGMVISTICAESSRFILFYYIYKKKVLVDYPPNTE